MLRLDKFLVSVASYAIPVPSLSLVSSDFEISLSIANEKVEEGKLVKRVYRAHLGALAIPYPLVVVNDRELVRGDKDGYVRLELSELGRYTVRFGLSKDTFRISSFEQEHFLVTESAVLTRLSRASISGVREAKHVVGGVEIPFRVRFWSREAVVRGARLYLNLFISRVSPVAYPFYLFVRVGKDYYDYMKQVKKRIYGFSGEEQSISIDLPPFRGPIKAWIWIAYYDGEDYVPDSMADMELRRGYIEAHGFRWNAASFYRNPEWGMRYMFIAHFPVHLYEIIYEFPEVVIPIKVWGIKPDDTTKTIEIPYELYRGIEVYPSNKAFFDGRAIPIRGKLRIVV